jgi:1-pyrroline-5-carboxylate dehydrogenase
MAGNPTHAHVPPPVNEPLKTYAPGTPERATLKAKIAEQSGQRVEVPLIIDGQDVRTGETAHAVMPHDHKHVLADWHRATSADVERAIKAALRARQAWADTAFADRAAIFLKAADMLAGPWRATLNAATMLGQSKSVYQAEIDSAAEMIDFLRFNVFFAEQIYNDQPISDRGMWNQLDHRPLEGFVYAVTPFNFTAIAGNLPSAPALMGNVVVWKPSEHAMLSAYYLMRLFEAAGLPAGVINLVGGDPATVSSVTLGHEALAGVHYTGSTAVFAGMWKSVAQNLERYRNFPRIVGETGGKDFVVAHPTADPATLAVAIARGGFEFQGQKCSAIGRVYLPRSLWPDVRDRVAAIMRELTMGDVADFRTFMGAVIHRGAFDRITGYLALAHKSTTATIIEGGEADATTGFFIRPTLIQTTDPSHRLMTEEVFGPVVTAYVYDDAAWAQTLELIDHTSPYALTGAVFAREKSTVAQASHALRYSAGNFYINDKPTGAVVGQQPFGGARHSGTNDKAGSRLNLLRWVSPRTIKENFGPPTDFRYPHMGEA